MQIFAGYNRENTSTPASSGGGIANCIRCLFVKGIVDKMGTNRIVEPGADVHENCILGNQTSICPHCMVGPKCVFKGHNMMGPNEHIYTTNHIYSEITLLSEPGALLQKTFQAE